MASFHKTKTGSIQVKITKNGNNIKKTFNDMETAQLYAKYKDDLVDEMAAFEVPNDKLITLDSAIQIKVEKLKELDRDPKTIADVANLRKDFHDWIDLSLSQITYEMMKERANFMLKDIVKRGGSPKNDTGMKVIQSPVTVRKKFAALSSVVSQLNEMGMDIENRAYRLLGFIQDVINKSKE